MRSLRILPAAALIAAAVPLSVAVAPHTAHAATSGPPQTVPAVRTWTAGSGSYTWSTASRVVINPAYASQLQGDANTFAADLGALEGRVVGVAQGTAGPGDIALMLGGSQPTEGYIAAEAHIIEPLGPYDIVDLKIGKLLVRARTPSGFVDRAGDSVWVRLDEKQTHFFSTRSGQSLNIRL